MAQWADELLAIPNLGLEAGLIDLSLKYHVDISVIFEIIRFMNHNFKTTPFEGSLSELLQILSSSWMPSQENLEAFESWLGRQLEFKENVFPIRKFSPSMAKRGTLQSIDGRHFVAVDNEPLAFFYEIARRSQLDSFLEGRSLVELIKGKAIPLSWSLDAPLEGQLKGFEVKTGGVSAEFRDHGILLAHIQDAAQGQSSGTFSDYEKRFFASLSAFNIMPWPSIRVTTQEITSGFDSIPGGNPKDLSGMPTIQNAFRAFVEKRFSESESYKKHHARIYGEGQLPSAQDLSAALDRAQQIKIRISPKNKNLPTAMSVPKSQRTVQVPAALPDNTAAIGYPFDTQENQYKNLESLIGDLRGWATDLANAAVQLDGSVISNSNPKPWIYFEVSNFPGTQVSVPQFSQGRNQTQIGTRLMRLSDFNGTYRIHGDTKKSAILELLRLFDSLPVEQGSHKEEDPSSIDAAQLFQPALTHSWNKKLNLAWFDGANGFYAYYQ